MGKGWIGAAAVLAGALALSGCHRGHDSGDVETTTETTVAPPMANVVTPAAPKPVVAKPTAEAVTTHETVAQPDAQRLEDAAAVGMTSRTGPGGYTSSSSSTSSTSTTVTHSTTTGPATPPASPQ